MLPDKKSFTVLCNYVDCEGNLVFLNIKVLAESSFEAIEKAYNKCMHLQPNRAEYSVYKSKLNREKYEMMKCQAMLSAGALNYTWIYN